MTRRGGRGRGGRGRAAPAVAGHLATVEADGSVDLGTYGVAKPLPRQHFGWFGARIRIRQGLTELVMIDLLERAEGVELEGDLRNLSTQQAMQLMGMVKKMMRDFIDPADFDRFWQLTLDNGQDSQNLMELAWGLLEKVTNLPTGRPSDSSGGPRETSSTSEVSYWRQEAAPFIRDYNQAGRPDLALQLDIAVAAQERASALRSA